MHIKPAYSQLRVLIFFISNPFPNTQAIPEREFEKDTVLSAFRGGYRFRRYHRGADVNEFALIKTINLIHLGLARALVCVSSETRQGLLRKRKM